MTDTIDIELIAPCGINCGICLAHLRMKNPCPGCRIYDPGKPKTRTQCRIKNCSLLSATDSGYCFSCNEYPCKRLRNLDNRYRAKYNMSMIENLDLMEQVGISEFARGERSRWRCPGCGGVICGNLGYCLVCEQKSTMG